MRWRERLAFDPGSLFVAVHILIGGFIGLVERKGFADLRGGYAESGAERQFIIASLCQALFDVCHDLVRLFAAALRTQDQELVAADTHGEAVRRDRVCDRVGNAL